MTHMHNANIHPLPSSILHNSNEVRRQYTRAAARQAVQIIARKFGSWSRKAKAATQDMPQAIQG